MTAHRQPRSELFQNFFREAPSTGKAVTITMLRLSRITLDECQVHLRGASGHSKGTMVDPPVPTRQIALPWRGECHPSSDLYRS